MQVDRKRYVANKLRLGEQNATLMLTAGVNIKVVQQRLGHVSISTNMDIYSHVTEEIEQEAAQKLDRGIFKLLIQVSGGTCIKSF